MCIFVSNKAELLSIATCAEPAEYTTVNDFNAVRGKKTVTYRQAGKNLGFHVA